MILGTSNDTLSKGEYPRNFFEIGAYYSLQTAPNSTRLPGGRKALGVVDRVRHLPMVNKQALRTPDLPPNQALEASPRRWEGRRSAELTPPDFPGSDLGYARASALRRIRSEDDRFRGFGAATIFEADQKIQRSPLAKKAEARPRPLPARAVCAGSCAPPLPGARTGVQTPPAPSKSKSTGERLPAQTSHGRTAIGGNRLPQP